MAVPKKRTSKTKKNIRKSVWKKKTDSNSLKALSLGRSLLTRTFTEKKAVSLSQSLLARTLAAESESKDVTKNT